MGPVPSAQRGGHPSGPGRHQSVLSDRHPCSAMPAEPTIARESHSGLRRSLRWPTSRTTDRQPVVVLVGTRVTSGTGYGPRFSSDPPVVCSARRGWCSGYAFVRIFHHRGEATAWADASAPELRTNHWGVTFSGPRADEDPNPPLPSLPMVAVAVGWNVGVGDLAEADLFADLDRERLPPCIGRHCQIAVRQFGLGRPERDSANDHRLSRRSGWSWGTSTKTIRTPSGSSIHISTSPQGSCCGPRTTDTPAASSLRCSASTSRT
jgi:hypothetical protein